MYDINLAAGTVKVLANEGDQHFFRLHNPPEQEVISQGFEYVGEFVSPLGATSPFVIDVTEVEEGILSFEMVSHTGTFYVRRVDPRRTLLTMEVQTE